MALPTQEEALKAYREYHQQAGLEPAWLMVDFQLWWKATHLEVCAIKKAARNDRKRCSKPCPYCLAKLER